MNDFSSYCRDSVFHRDDELVTIEGPKIVAIFLEGVELSYAHKLAEQFGICFMEFEK